MSDSQSNEALIFENIKCIVCKNTNKELFTFRYTKKNYAVVECQKCGFHFIPPFYRKQIDYTKYKSADVTAEIKKSDTWLKIQRNLLRYQLIRKYHKKGKVFDVGAGFGHFMLAGKQLGYAVSGIELSRANVDFIKNELNLAVEYGNFLNLPENEKYDIVTLWDVLEHIDEADQVIQKAAKFLKPGGMIFLQVPQWDSFFAAILKDKWWAMGLDHVNYFTKKTIEKLLASHGFKVKKFQSSLELKNILTYVILPKLKSKKKAEKSWTTAERQKEFNKLTHKPKWLLWLFVKMHNFVYKILSFFHIGDEMIVVAEKL